jgi:hypothetical protein
VQFDSLAKPDIGCDPQRVGMISGHLSLEF